MLRRTIINTVQTVRCNNMNGILLTEAMNTAPFSQAHLIAGSGGLNRSVLSANIQEVPNVENWLKGGEIVFTTGFAFRTAEGGVRLLNALDKKGAAALAVKTGPYLPEIPQEMILCADRLNFPLFRIPEDMPYMDCIIPIFERITQCQLHQIMRSEDIHDQLIQSMAEQKGLSGICAILSRLTGCGSYVVSTHGLILARDPASGQKCTFEKQETEQMLEHLFARPSIRFMKRNQCNLLTADNGLRIACVPVYTKRELIAYLILPLKTQEPDGTERQAFENAGTLVAAELLREKEAQSRERRIRAQLLDDLLDQRFSSDEVIIRRGRLVNMDFNGKNFVFLLGISSFEKQLTEKKRMPEKRIQRIKEDIYSELEHQCEKRDLTILMTTRGMDTIGLVSVLKGSERNSCAAMLNELVQMLRAKYNLPRLFSGIGREKTDMHKLSESYTEARCALKAGGSVRQEGNTVTCFESLGCLTFLCELEGSRAAASFYQEYMGPLETYDKDNQGILAETLEGYFFCGRNLRKTADYLFIHKNSVIYRLSKIESLIGKSLSDEQVCFNLELCLKLRQLF